MKKLAVFVVDAQKGFTPLKPNELPVAGGHLIVDEINKALSFADVMVGSKDWHLSTAVWVAPSPDMVLTKLEGHDDANVYWPAHCVGGTDGAELLDGLPAIKDFDYFVWKGMEPSLHPYSAVYHDLGKTRNRLSTGVIEYFQSVGVTDVVVVGLAYDYCVRDTALDLSRAGFNTAVYKPATASVSPETETLAEYAFKAGKIAIFNSIEQIIGMKK